MAVYSLNEGLFSKKPKLNFTSEQKKECKDIEAQIKKIGPSLVNKYNKDKDLLHKLQNATRRDMLPRYYDQPDVTNGITYKFVFDVICTNMINDRHGQHYFISIDLLKCLKGAMDEYLSEIDDDNLFEAIDSVVGKVYEEVGKELINQIHPSTVNVKCNYEDVYSGLDIVITPKPSETNESVIDYHEECASIEEYIDSLDEFAICDIDREYITEGLSSVLNKIKASAAATKKKLKDKADKIKKEWQKNNELNSYSAMVNGSYFTNLKVTIDDYIELPSFYDAFANSQDVLDDLTYIFETAWKKIVNIRKENSKYTDYNAALKDLNKIKADVDKQYAKFDIDGRMEEVFGLDGKASQHTINNKDVAALISSYQAVGTSEEEVMWLISKAIAVVDDELDDLSSMTEDYQKQLDKSGNDDEKSRLKYLIDSVDTLTEIEKSTSDAMGDYINIFNKCAREYQNLIEKYLDKVDVDAEKQIKK